MFLITTIFFLVSLNEMCKSKTRLRVLDGRDARDGEFPFVVSLFAIYTEETSQAVEEKPFRSCTGSIISPYWILTAAHCTANPEMGPLHIWLTNFTTSPLVTKSFKKVKKTFIHPAFLDSDVMYVIRNDISLVLVDKLDMTSFGRLLAVDHLTMMGLPVIYVGSGGTNKPGDDDLRPLQVGEAGIVKCSKTHNYTKYAICITSKCDNRLHKPWYGDSGGPLLYDGRIIGVCSYGFNNSIITEEAYAAISPHMNWIYNVMQNNI